MSHWNGNILCAGDIKTSGPNPEEDELLQFAILPLNSNLELSKEIKPFFIYLKPEKEGMEPIQGIDVFDKWADSLQLEETRFGRRKKIFILSYDYDEKKPFIIKWLGYHQYNKVFDKGIRDLNTITKFLNDKASCHFKKVPYSKNELAYIARALEVEYSAKLDILACCRIMINIYRTIVNDGLFG